MASSLLACQEQLAHVLRKLESTNGTLSSLSDRIDRIEQKLDEQSSREEQTQDEACKGKRKRTKYSLTIQVCNFCTYDFGIRRKSLIYGICS
jgi:chromosome segregation ATPase